MARILIIEDEPALRQLMHCALVNDKHSVSEATDGRVGTVILAREKFDLVITDMLMPEMDGVEVIQVIRRWHPGLPILAISGGGKTSANFYLSLATKLGVQKVLAKPFSSEELLVSVRELVDQTAFRSENQMVRDTGFEPVTPTVSR